MHFHFLRIFAQNGFTLRHTWHLLGIDFSGNKAGFTILFPHEQLSPIGINFGITFDFDGNGGGSDGGNAGAHGNAGAQDNGSGDGTQWCDGTQGGKGCGNGFGNGTGRTIIGWHEHTFAPAPHEHEFALTCLNKSEINKLIKIFNLRIYYK